MIDIKEVKALLKELRKLKEVVLEQKVDSENVSIKNMYHYLKLRSRDNTKLQDRLSLIGLSSLGRSQMHVIDSLNHVIEILSALSKEENVENMDSYLTIKDSLEIAQKNRAIFGVENLSCGIPKVLLTLPTDSANDREFIKEMLNLNVNMFRVNTSHDSSEVWKSMINNIKSQNPNAIIFADIAGPKIRTGKISRVEPSIKIGSKVETTTITISTNGQTKSESINLKGKKVPANLVVSEEFFKELKEGDKILFYDALDKKRELLVTKKSSNLVEATIDKKVILSNETVLKLKKKKNFFTSTLKDFEDTIEEIRLFDKDKIFITTDDIFGSAKTIERDYAVVSCTNKEAMSCVKKGERVFIDDGKLGLKVTSIKDNGVMCEVILAKDKGFILKEEKGINFPDSDINLKAITKEDKKNIAEIIDLVDIFGVSFAQSKEDILDLLEIINKSGREIGVVAKIETKKAISNLPEIIEGLLQAPKSAIMIARGDLAIEAGFENLALLQEEIFELCASAHIPVILATQVLETQMKTNIPSRAEVIDAGTAQRADCVMLNKGPYAIDTIKKLNSIFEQMKALFNKNKQLLGECKIWKIKRSK